MPTIGGIVVSTGGKATGRRQFSDVIDELARPVNAADETIRALAADSFRAAVRTMNRKADWPWEIQEEDITIEANKRRSSVQSAIKKPLSMHRLTAEGGVEKRPIAYQTYDRYLERASMDYSGGDPLFYTIPNLFETGEILWAPLQSATRYARFAYYRVTAIPRNESESLEMPEYASEAYMAIAWEEFYKRCPAARGVLDPVTVFAGKRLAFRELTAHVNRPGDRSRSNQSRLTST